MKPLRDIGCCSAAIGVALVVLMGTSTTALAPEPARLAATGLGSTDGSWASADYVSSGRPTTVFKWTSEPKYSPELAARKGQPCSTVWLAPYSVTSFVFVDLGHGMVKCSDRSGKTTQVASPEPAVLTADMDSFSGPGVYLYSRVATTIYFWPTTARLSETFVGGEPCSPVALAVGAITYQAIQPMGGGLFKCA